MNNKQIVLSIAAVVVLFGALYGVYALIGGGPDQTLIKQIAEERPASRTMWNKNGKHTLAVMSDYQCPACKIFHEYLTGFTASTSPYIEVPKNTAFVFRYFPLYQIHQHAYYLAYAAEAAARQGKFEEISKRFFADQTKLETVPDIKQYVAEVVKDLKMDEKKFQKDVNDGALQGLVQADLQLGEKLGVNATPTFFLDGKQLDSMSPLDLANLLKDQK